MSPDKHALRFTDEEEVHVEAAPEPAITAEAAAAPTADVDMAALAAEHAEQEAWLASFHPPASSPPSPPARQPHGRTAAHLAAGAVERGDAHVAHAPPHHSPAIVSTQPALPAASEHTPPPAAAHTEHLPPSTEEHLDADAGVGAGDAGSGAARDSSAPFTLADCPLMYIPAGYQRSDVEAEVAAGHVWLSNARAQEGPYPLSQAECTGLLAVSVLRCAHVGPLLDRGTADGDEQQPVCVRVCLVQSTTPASLASSPSLPSASASTVGGGVGLPTTLRPRLRVPANMNPFTARRTPLYRTPKVAVPDLALLLGDGGDGVPAGGAVGLPPRRGDGVLWWQQDVCLCALTSSSSSSVEGRPSVESTTPGTLLADPAIAAHGVRAEVDWGYLGGYLLFQVMQQLPPGTASSAVSAGDTAALPHSHTGTSTSVLQPGAPGHVIRAQGLIRLCDVFAGVVGHFAPSDEEGGLYPLLHPSSAPPHRGPRAASGAPHPQQFALRLWLPLQPIEPAAAHSRSAAHQRPHGLAAAPPPQLLVCVVLVLPPAFAVPAAALTPAPSPSRSTAVSTQAGWDRAPPLRSPKRPRSTSARVLAPTPHAGGVISVGAAPSLGHSVDGTASRLTHARSSGGTVTGRPGMKSAVPRPRSAGAGRKPPPRYRSPTPPAGPRGYGTAGRPPHPYLTLEERQARWMGEDAVGSHAHDAGGDGPADEVGGGTGGYADDRPDATGHRAWGAHRPSASYGTAWQAVGAKGLPPHIRPDDAASVKVHVAALQAVVSGLQAQLHHERIALARANAELGRWKHAVAMAPVAARMAVGTRPGAVAAPSSGGTSSDDGVERHLPVDPAELLALAQAAQDDVKAALVRLQATQAGSGGGAVGRTAPVPPEDTVSRLRREAATMRGRAAALRERLRREAEVAALRASRGLSRAGVP